MINLAKGDLLQTECDIIAHQVNCKGVMGAGVALQIKRRYPQVYERYVTHCRTTPPDLLLGQVRIIGYSSIKIANMFAQAEYGTGKVQTNYKAFRLCCEKLYTYAKDNKYSVAMPHGIGCGLAGGNWKVVFAILENVFTDVDLTLYKL